MRRERKNRRLLAFFLCLMLSFNLVFTDFVAYAYNTEESMANATNNTSNEAVSADIVDDVSVEGVDSFGNMLQNELDDVIEEQEDNHGYNVFSVEMEGNIATVDYEAKEDCTLVVAVYDNEGNQMLGSGSIDVSSEETLASVEIGIESMPSYFYIRAYLVEEQTLMPLCTEFDSNLYTQAMQEFLAKKPEDFDANKVLEIDEESNSFLVFNDTTNVIPYNESFNTIEKMDDTNLEYIISNPDDNFSALQAGDVFSYEYEAGQILIVDIASIENVDGKLLITGNKTKLEDVFEHIKVDASFDNSNATVDPDSCGEYVEYIEPGTTYNRGYNRSQGIELEIEKEFKVSNKKNDKDENYDFHGSIGVKATGEVKVYKDDSVRYVEYKICLTFNAHVGLKAKNEIPLLKLGKLSFMPVSGVIISVQPQIVLEVEADIQLEAELYLEYGIKVDDDDVVEDISKDPRLHLGLHVEGKIYFGAKLKPEIKFICEKLFELEFSADGGVEFKFEHNKIETSEEKGIIHTCDYCVEAELYGKIKLSGEIQLLGVDFLKLTINFYDEKFKITDMYMNEDDEFGLTKCPYVKYRIKVVVTNEKNWPFEGVLINEEYETDENGEVEFYLSRGKYNVSAEKKGYFELFNTLKVIEIDDKEIIGYIIMAPKVSGEITVSDNVAINNVNFPDNKFREYILDYIDLNDDEILSKEEITSTNEIDCSWSGISDLTGIGYFGYLIKLDCGDNDINTLDLTGCKSLIYLDCNSNNISTLNISDCAMLTELACENNSLSDLDLSKCDSLQTVYCSRNSMEVLNLDDCAMLEYLYCRSNNISELDVSDCSSLIELDCDDNVISTLDVSNCDKLETLSCDNNNISTLNIEGCDKLKDLYCQSNNITSLDLSNRTSLENLDCSYCDLITLDVSGCTALEFLYCYFCYDITTLNVDGCTSLVALYCYYNSISELDLSECTSLLYLKCYDNDISTLNVSNCSLLEEINCSSNNIETLDLSDCTSLEDLNCAMSNISSINLENCYSLLELNCIRNNIADLDIADCKALESLSCDTNKLELLDISMCAQLEELSCGENNISKLDLSENTNLIFLSCNNNRIDSINVNECSLLERLYCNDNNINTLNVDNNTKLEYLLCNNNNISALDVSKCTLLEDLQCNNNIINMLNLDNCKSLRFLYCNNNSIDALDVYDCTSLSSLECADNNLTQLDVSNCAKLGSITCDNNNIDTLDTSNNLQLSYLSCNNNNISVLIPSVDLYRLYCENNNITTIDVSDIVGLGFLNCSYNNLGELNLSNNSGLQQLTCNNNNISSLNLSNCERLEYLNCCNNLLGAIDVSGCSSLKSYNIKCDKDVVIIRESTTITNALNSSAQMLQNNTEVEDSLDTESIDYGDTYVDEEPPVHIYESSTSGTIRIIHQNKYADDDSVEYSGLYPNEIYNLYVVKEATDDEPYGDVLNSDNLLYIKQYTSNADGVISADYAPISEYENAKEILVCINKIDISAGYTVSVSNPTYTGEEQSPDIEVMIDGIVLLEGEDYIIDGDYYVTDEGKYSITILGIDRFEGTIDISYAVKKYPVEKIILDKADVQLDIGEFYYNYYEISPVYAYDQSVIWSSSNTDVVEVYSYGDIYAISAGTATITASAADGSGVTASYTVTVLPLDSEEPDVPTTEEPSEPTTEEPTTEEPTTEEPTTEEPTTEEPTTEEPTTEEPTTEEPTTEEPTTEEPTTEEPTTEAPIPEDPITPPAEIPTPNVDVTYHTHIQTLGDSQGTKKNGEMAGTSGMAKRLENIWIKIEGNDNLGIQYTTHCQTYGWMPWSCDGESNGTSKESKRLEAIKIQLTGADKDKYDVYYRVHAQSYGWLGWAKNGEPSGTAGYGKRLEGIQVVVVKKGETAPGLKYAGVDGSSSKYGKQAYVAKTNGAITIPGNTDAPNVMYKTHVQTYGWQKWMVNGQMSGTSGKSKRLEGINIKLTNAPYDGDIVYTTHVQKYGWKDGKPTDAKSTWKKNGEMSGTNGEAKRLEAICIDLTGEMAEHYDVYYRVHAQTFGWLGWAKNGEESGTAGYAKRLEGIQIVLVPKDGAAPADNYGGITAMDARPFIEKK